MAFKLLLVHLIGKVKAMAELVAAGVEVVEGFVF